MFAPGDALNIAFSATKTWVGVHVAYHRHHHVSYLFVEAGAVMKAQMRMLLVCRWEAFGYTAGCVVLACCGAGIVSGMLTCPERCMNGGKSDSNVFVFSLRVPRGYFGVGSFVHWLNDAGDQSRSIGQRTTVGYGDAARCLGRLPLMTRISFRSRTAACRQFLGKIEGGWTDSVFVNRRSEQKKKKNGASYFEHLFSVRLEESC